MNYELAAELIYGLMLYFFEGDEELTEEWLQHSNPFLGYMSPLSLMRSGYYEDVLEFAQLISDRKGQHSGE